MTSRPTVPTPQEDRMPDPTAPDAALEGLEETPHTGESVGADGTMTEPSSDDFGHA